MCLIVPSRVVGLTAEGVEVELSDGQRTLVNGALKPDLAVGDYVLVDRGLVVETLEADEAEAIISMYREIGQLLEAEDALP
jgi:hydrogenase assembly chaperone HypC/HupF